VNSIAIEVPIELLTASGHIEPPTRRWQLSESGGRRPARRLPFAATGCERWKWPGEFQTSTTRGKSTHQ
jgi:hypothetical protein